MLELEKELAEFQDSSKELEQALEEELRVLETQATTLTAQIQAKDAKIRSLTETVAQLNLEINEQSTRSVEEAAEYEKKISDLKHKLIHMEILNDDMVSRDRVLESKLLLATQFNDELLEKIAMVENELELERQANARHRLTITNLETEKSERANVKEKEMSCFGDKEVYAEKRIGRDSTFQDFSFAEGTILDIGEMLASEPPKNVVPRSESLLLFQELYTKSGALRQKVGEVNMSLAFKSPSTTHITKRSSTLGSRTPTVVLEATGTDSRERSAALHSVSHRSSSSDKNDPQPTMTKNKLTKYPKSTLKGLIRGFLRD